MVCLQFHSIYCKNNPIKHGDYYRHVLKKIKLDHYWSSSSSSVGVVRATDKEYEIDPDKAKEALQKLDQQLQELSQKQVSSPKTKALDVKITRDDQTIDDEEEVMAEIQGSTFALVTAGFFLFTIFYNIFYITVIDKPR